MSTQRIMATPANQSLAGEDISDDDLAELLAADPYVKIRGPRMTIETQPEVLPDAPDHCPECGESYERRSFDQHDSFDDSPPERFVRYIHHSTGFGGEWCEVPTEWTPQKTITVRYERAKRVSR